VLRAGDPARHPERLSSGQRAVFALSDAVGQTVAGRGLYEYYEYGLSRTLGDELPAAARLIGAEKHAALFERANALFPRDEDGTLRVDPALEEDPNVRACLDDLSHEFFDLEREVGLVDCMLRFVCEHPDEF
jgi:hypothetical protein